jgi:hypothetical protein
MEVTRLAVAILIHILLPVIMPQQLQLPELLAQFVLDALPVWLRLSPGSARFYSAQQRIQLRFAQLIRQQPAQTGCLRLLHIHLDLDVRHPAVLRCRSGRDYQANIYCSCKLFRL